MVAGRAKLCIERYWEVVGGLLIGTNPNPITAKFGDLKTPHLNYCQAVADGAKLCIDGRREVIVVANAPKYSVDSHYVVLGKTFFLHIGSLSPTICRFFLFIV